MDTMYQEKLIKKYFQTWLDKNNDAWEDIFDENIIYVECYGPEYHGFSQLSQWFRDWNLIAAVLEWEIKGFIHQNNTTAVEWYFKCNYNGEVSGFDGVSIVKFNNMRKIIEIREFQSKSDHYFPYD